MYNKSKYGRGKHPNSRNSSHLFQKDHKYYGGDNAKKTQFKKGNTNRLGMKHSKATKDKISEVQIGRKANDDTKRKMSETAKNNPHDGWFKKGQVPWNKDKKLPSSWNKDIIGKDSHSWQGGISFEPYTADFNKLLKKIIKGRDGKCMLCNISFQDLKLLKRAVHIHHINYDKINCMIQNLISLCANCHGLTGTNRKHWTSFFQQVLSENYNYEYSSDGKIVLDFIDFNLKK